MLYKNADLKNVLQDDNARWPKAVVPYFIEKTDFCEYKNVKIRFSYLKHERR